MSPRPAKTLLTGLLLVFANFVHAQTATVGVYFSSPTANQAVDSNLTIQVTTRSTYQIGSVMATVKGRRAPLTYNSGAGLYTGTLSLAGLPVDSTDTLSVTATDVNNNTGTVSETIFYDPPPVVTLTAPYEDAVARPNLHVKATCAASGGHCQISVVIIQGTTQHPAGTFTDSCNTMVDVSAYEGAGSMYLQVTGADQYGVQGQEQVQDFFVETSPYLTPIYSANNSIAGFLGNRVLIADKLSFVDSPRIANVTTGALTSIPFKGQVQYSNGAYITTPGAVFIGQWANQAGVPSGPTTLYDWNNGHLDSVGSINSNLRANGNYCTWSYGTGQVYFRNLATQTTQLIPTGSRGGYANDVSASGAVAYNSFDPVGNDTILLYQNGASTFIQNAVYPLTPSAPLTDGTNVAYLQQDVSGNASIYRYDAKTATNGLLSSLGNQGQVLVPSPWYLVNSGYTAYLQPDASSHFQIWLRDTAGHTAQASFFSVSSTLETLASNGQEAYFNTAVNGNGLRYIYDPKSAGSLAISSELGKSYYQDSSWYLTIGNTLFRVNLNIAADKADSFAVNTKKDSLYTFTLNDFTSHYQTSGSLLSVVISRLPTNGTLTLNGTAVGVNKVFSRTDLPNLVYKPNTGFSGSDTLVWTGSNGFTASPASALLVIKVLLPAPPVPVISGLASSYCAMAAVQKVRITNIPGPAAAVTVSASIDGQPVTVGSDSTVTIASGTLGVGTHRLQVVFSNATTADTLTDSIVVNAAVTPVVRLASSVSTVNASSGPIVLTATAVSGGGTTPQFTFARDINFTNIVQAAGTAQTVTVSVSSLAVGRNEFYVRMQTSDSCYAAPSGVDSIVVVLEQDSTPNGPPVAPPAVPQLSGLQAEYCGSAEGQAVAITNMPAAGVTVVAAIDGAAVSVAANGQFFINPGVLGAGVHSLRVIFTDSAGADTTVRGFSIEAAAMPVVALRSSVSTVDLTVPSVVLTASAVSGSGATPTYTFYSDSGFDHVLQAESTIPTLTVSVVSLTVGRNEFYVRMTTSDSCFANQTAVDSLGITLLQPGSGGNRLIDMDNPGEPIYAGPNPFNGSVIVTGLMTSKSYSISLLGLAGQEIIRQQVEGQQQTVLYTDPGKTGVYFLRLYDETRNRVIGYVKLLALGR